MAGIKAGDFVECNIANLDQSLPKEKRTKFGCVISERQDTSSGKIFDVAILQSESHFRRATFEAKDVKQLSVPMPKYAQRELLAMARIFKKHLDLLQDRVARINAIAIDE